MLIGFDSVKSKLLSSYRDEKLHHAILLHGKKGIGKASFAQELSREILGNKGAIYSDLLLIEKDHEKKEITVDKVRKMSDFTNQTSAISGNKIIIINSACELNRSASNALLKVLEEPHQNSFLILISHNLNQVLPTIKSRCQLIKIPDLSRPDFDKILQQKNLHFLPKDLGFLSDICDNSPALAIDSGLELVRFYELFLRSIYNKKINEELLKKISDKNFSFLIFEKSYQFFISRLLKSFVCDLSDFYFDEEKVFLNIRQKLEAKNLLTIADETLSSLRKTTSLNLDKKLTLINIFNHICYE